MHDHPYTQGSTHLQPEVLVAVAENSTISLRLQSVASELRHIQDALLTEQEIDPRILTDFRDAVNRIRNTAWAMDQYANSKTTSSAVEPVLTVVAGERVRVAYQLARLVQADLANPQIRFQRGQLVSLSDVTHELAQGLRKVIERL
jgi:hypothetical protein